MLAKVTVVTVVFNLIQAKRKQSFERCVMSVLQQSYSNIEHLVIDGASTDGTLTIIQEYATKGWIRYISEPDTGIYDAMNKGIQLAMGDYIIFLNSDDYYHNRDAIKLSVTAIEESQADFTYATAKIINGKAIEIMDANIVEFWYHMPFCHQTMLCRKSVLMNQGRGQFNTHYRLAADYDLIMRLILQDYVGVCVPAEIVTFNCGGTSNSMLTLSQQEQCEILYHAYKGFYDFVDIDSAGTIIYLQQEKDSWHFVQLLSQFLVAKKLQHIDIQACLKSIQETWLTTCKIMTSVKLFKTVTLINIIRYHNIAKVKLFNCITLIDKKVKAGKIRIRLFGIIPLYYAQSVQMHTITYIKILGIFPFIVYRSNCQSMLIKV